MSGEWGNESLYEELTQDSRMMRADVAALRAEVAFLRAEVAASRAERRGGDSKSKELKEPKPKKVHTPKKESISCEANLKSLLDEKGPTLLANIPRGYKVFGNSHPLEKPLGTYLETLGFISLDRSKQTDGAGEVWVSLKPLGD